MAINSFNASGVVDGISVNYTFSNKPLSSADKIYVTAYVQRGDIGYSLSRTYTSDGEYTPATEATSVFTQRFNEDVRADVLNIFNANL